MRIQQRSSTTANTLYSPSMIPDQVLTVAQRAVTERLSLIGEEIVRVTDEHGGVWRIRHELRNDDRWELRVYAPREERGIRPRIFCSLSALTAEHARSVSPSSVAQNVSTLPKIAASFIQHHYRRHRYMASIRKAKSAQTLFRQSFMGSSLVFAERHLLLPLTQGLATYPQEQNTCSSTHVRPLSGAYDMDTLMQAADNVFAEVARTTALAFASRSFRTRTRTPMLIGHLPTPRGVRSHKGHTIEFTDSISEVHLALLTSRFASGWASHIVALLNNPDEPVCALDVFSTRTRDVHLGSIVFRKLLARSRGVYAPVIFLESFVTRESNVGSGSALYQLALDLVLADAPVCETGILIAQCLRIPFWEVRLDAGSLAGALLFQAQYHLSGVELYNNCTGRSMIVEHDDV